MGRAEQRYTMIEKPSDWPLNACEDLLERIQKSVSSLIDNPGFETREVLVSLLNAHDFNQQSVYGEDRISDYEVAVLNSLFEKSMIMCLPSLRCFLYSFIGLRTRMQKMLHLMSKTIPELVEVLPLDVNAYEKGLFPTLFIYYKVYQHYTVRKEHSFSEELCLFAEEQIKQNDSGEDYKKRLDVFERCFTTIIHDISFSRGNKTEDIWKFGREELLEILTVQAKILNILKKNPAERPLRTILMAEIGNYILRSRNEYAAGYIYKYISKEVAFNSFMNNEIWMSSIEKLNDSREGAVVKEVLADDSWDKVVWFDNTISFEKKRLYYVSSFSKSGKEERMLREYGPVVLGYKNDRIGDLISPIRKYISNQKTDNCGSKSFPMFSTVIAFDVLYDREKLKEELRFLFQAIDLFSMSVLDKNSFLENIIQYWMLSAKDEKWAYEKERRYVLFLYEENVYFETKIESNYLKEKSSLLLIPDFVLGNHCFKADIRKNIEIKRKALSCQPYLYCNNCFYWDYDLAHKTITERSKCPVCGSTAICIENK